MKGTDKFLIGIVVGIVLLVVIAFAVVLARPEPTYQAEEMATGVTHNYLLALQKEDYERAYRYLSPTLAGYPESVEAFAETVEDFNWRFRTDTETTLTVLSERVVGSRTVVEMRESRFYRGGLFGSGQTTNTFEVKLEQEAGAWKVVDAGYYFAPCWTDDEGCEN